MNNEELERKWESYWLNEYRERKGRWPVYNKISGLEMKVS